MLFFYLYSCCGIIEIFPQSDGCGKSDGAVCSYAHRIGHGNHARFLGYEYGVVGSQPHSLTRRGTIVDVDALKVRMSEVIDALFMKS